MMSPPSPFASVVIPAYNAARWIGATLDSWLAQTDQDFEVIVVDDGSSDATADIAESYRERLNLRVLREPPRGAPAGPCNVGTRTARGTLILPCDADDMAAPDRLQEVRLAWEAVSQRDCLIFTDYAEVDAQGAQRAASVLAKYPSLNAVPRTAVGPDLSLIANEAAFTALLGTGCFLRPCAVAIPRRVLEAVGGYDETLRNSQDYDLFLRIAWQFPFVWLQRKLAFYRVSDGNISSRPAAVIVPSRLAVMEGIRRLPLSATQLAAVNDNVARNFEALGYDLGARGQVLRSLAAYAQALRYQPCPSHLKGMAATLAKRVLRTLGWRAQNRT